jgi:MATE family multidrug resistance protein
MDATSSPRTLRTEVPALLKLATPVALAQAGQAAMGLVDTAVVGRLSAAAQGGVGVGNGVTFTVMVMGLGILLALDPLISQAIGANEPRRAREAYWQGIWLSLILGAVLALPLAIVPWFFEAAGVEPAMAVEARKFVLWRIPGMLPFFLFTASRSYLQGQGRPAILVWAMVVANLVNFGLDLVLVFGAGPIPAFGVPGAAMATNLCSLLQWVILVKAIGPAPADTVKRFSRAIAAKIVHVGLPIGLQMSAEVGVFALAALLAGRLGEASAAAHQVAITWGSLSFCFAIGVGNAASTRVGWAIGADDTPGARLAGKGAFVAGVVVMGVWAFVFSVFSYPVARLLTDKESVLALAVPLMGVTALFQISDGVQAVGAGILRGIADTRFAFVANVAGHYLVGLPIAVLFGLKLGYGVQGLWWGLCAGLTAVAILLPIRFFSRTRQRILRAID